MAFRRRRGRRFGGRRVQRRVFGRRRSIGRRRRIGLRF